MDGDTVMIKVHKETLDKYKSTKKEKFTKKEDQIELEKFIKLSKDNDGSAAYN